MSYTVIDHGNENTRVEETQPDAEEKVKQLKSLVSNPNNIELVAGDFETYEEYKSETELHRETDGGDVPTPEPAEFDTPDAPDTDSGLDQLGESLGQDPLEILPGHMIDQIQGQPAINKRGYAMIAERYGVSVKSYIESYPWDNDEGRCVARAVAVTDEGKEYQDFATARADDGDMPEQLVELASTRALKRVTGWATGLGIVSYQELASELEDTL